MLSNNELEKCGVFTFENYGDKFYNSDIIIGNGFSINLCERLNYKALHDLFLKTSSKELEEIFKLLGTSNFELILDTIEKTNIISQSLGVNISSLPRLINELKDGLIISIQNTHPRYAETNMHILRSLAAELSIFRNIFTTNYDIFLYKIILANNELVKLNLLKSIEFQDAFYEELNPTQLGFGDIDDSRKQIFYLHGALFLYSEKSVTYKLRKIDASVEFINLIRREVQNNNFPLFVSEGSSEAKRERINSNYYLRECSERLKNNNNDCLTSYGFSFSSPDNHIVDYISKSKIKQILISIYPDYDSIKDLEIELSRLRNLFGNLEVLFYDSRSLFSFDYPKHNY
jgi:hypothetical protein